MKKAIAIILSVLLIDQTIKIWVKTHMHIGKALNVTGEWFYIHFVENPGMAFGITIGDGDWGKLLLSVFRLVAVAGIGWYLWTLSKKHVRPLLMVCVALIFAGALGNILDSVFYGKIFSQSDLYEGNVAEFMPKEGGYAGVLHGQVVDMFYFPVWEGNFPEWLPSQENTSLPDWFPRAGEDFLFFRPVFNIADAAISVGVFLLIVFQRRLFGKNEKLSERKIFVTNIFFGFVVFLISVFLLLTYTTILSEIHPLSKLKMGIVFALAAAAGYGMYAYLQRYPRFVPELEAEVKTEETPGAENTPTEPEAPSDPPQA